MIKSFLVKGKYPPLNQKDFKYIKLLGIELEGGWDDKPETYKGVLPFKTDSSIQNLKRDQLVHNCHKHIYHKICNCALEDGESCDNPKHCVKDCSNPFHCSPKCAEKCKCAPPTGLVIGETVSEPSSLEQIREFISLLNPTKTNETCGLHVHVSFKKDHYYSKLMTKNFYNFFLSWFKNWGNEMGFQNGHPFWDRLTGNNKYCHKNFVMCDGGGHHTPTQHLPENQIINIQTGGNHNPDRYAHLNFAYKKLGTLECRLFPGFEDPALTMSAIESFARCLETFLDSQMGNEEEEIKEEGDLRTDNLEGE